jgi:coenzyme F420-0:L-glutamate ligase/coenzyme F420-1:gamma-L-glutamate ligase
MTTSSLTLTPLPDIPLIQPGDNLAAILLSSLERASLTLQDGDVLVLAQKIVSKAEGRFVNLNEVLPTERARELAGQAEKDPHLVELILRESREVLRVRPGTIIVEHRLGFISASAGIDHSNVQGPYGPAEAWVLLLPVDPDRSAADIRARLEAKSGKRLGVMIIDSHGRAWRLGVVGTCIGLSGLPGLVDKRGDPDLFGYHLRITLIAAADELAAAASLVMGQADEARPAVHVRGFPYPLREGTLSELLRPKEKDLFR